MSDPPAAARGLCLGFDFGAKRIGVAVGESSLGGARALATVANRGSGPDWAAVDALLGEWSPVALVVGLPLDADGAEQPITAHARGFARRLARRSGLPVHAVDERYSSMQAQDDLRDARASGRRAKRAAPGDLDALAAAVILERWFASVDAC